MKLNFPQVQSVIHTMFYTPKTQNGLDETQLPSSSKCHSCMFYTPNQNGMNETPLPFELKVSFMHVLHPENSKWNE